MGVEGETMPTDFTITLIYNKIYRYSDVYYQQVL